MGCFDTCFFGPFGARCCNVISILGFIYFGLNFLIFNQQQDFYEFTIKKPTETRISMLISSLILLVFALGTFYRIHQLNVQRQNQSSNKESIHNNPVLITDHNLQQK